MRYVRRKTAAKSQAAPQPVTRRQIDPDAFEDEGVRRYAVMLQARVDRQQLDPGTAHAYLADVAAYAAALAQGRKSTEPLRATCADVADYFEQVVTQTSPNTARRKLASLRSFYRALEELGLTKVNPTRDLQPPPLRRSTPLRKPIQSGVMKQLLATPSEETAKGLRDRALLILLALYGLPVIEAHRLNVTDVDLRAAGRTRREGMRDRAGAGHNPCTRAVADHPGRPRDAHAGVVRLAALDARARRAARAAERARHPRRGRRASEKGACQGTRSELPQPAAFVRRVGSGSWR